MHPSHNLQQRYFTDALASILIWLEFWFNFEVRLTKDTMMIDNYYENILKMKIGLKCNCDSILLRFNFFVVECCE